MAQELVDECLVVIGLHRGPSSVLYLSIESLEESNRNAENTLRVVAGNIYGSKLMKRYVEEMTKKEREKRLYPSF